MGLGIGLGTRGLKGIHSRLPITWRDLTLDRQNTIPAITQGHLLKGNWRKPKKTHGLNPLTLHPLVSFTMIRPLWTYAMGNIV